MILTNQELPLTPWDTCGAPTNSISLQKLLTSHWYSCSPFIFFPDSPDSGVKSLFSFFVFFKVGTVPILELFWSHFTYRLTLRNFYVGTVKKPPCTSLKTIIFDFFLNNGGKLSIETTVEKNEEKTITSHFSATHTYIKPSLMVFFRFFCIFLLLTGT